ncbi:hypothetical protein D3C78_1779030 [compost metagenome]
MQDLRRLPDRLRQRQFQFGGRAGMAAAFVFHAEHYAPHRQLPRGEPAAQLFGQAARHRQHGVGVLDVVHEFDAPGELVGRFNPAIQFRRLAVGGVQGGE